MHQREPTEKCYMLEMHLGLNLPTPVFMRSVFLSTRPLPINLRRTHLLVERAGNGIFLLSVIHQLSANH